MPKLTKKTIDEAKPKEKRYTIWDTEIKGFGCTINPLSKGISRKTYSYYYRLPKSLKLNYLKIGVHGSITPDIAREIAQAWAMNVARGIDPKIARQNNANETEKRITFEQFFEIFTERHRKIENKPNTLKIDQYNIKNHLLPFFGKKELISITTQDIFAYKDKLKEHPGTYNRSFNMLRSALNKAEVWDYIPKQTNPCNKISKYPEKKMERFLSIDELKNLEQILNSDDIRSRYSAYARGVLFMLIYTGCRKGEVLSLKWGDIHLDDNYVLLKDSKAGERIVALNKSTVAVLNEIKPQADNPYVFCGEKRNSHTKNIDHAWQTIRKIAGLPDVRIHDLRHSFASFAIKQGVDIFRVAKLLGHKDIKTTMRYAHIAKDELVNASNVVGEVFGK